MNSCGCSCEGCASLPAECAGCETTGGKPYWTQYIGKEACPVYACCEDKRYGDCGECEALPCETWFLLKDPSMTDEEHQKSIAERVDILKNGGA